MKRARLGMRLYRQIIKAHESAEKRRRKPERKKEFGSNQPPRTTVPAWWPPLVEAHMALRGQELEQQGA